MTTHTQGGRFVASDKPRATIHARSEGYYILTMGEREMGGTNKVAMAAYARKLGFTVCNAVTQAAQVAK